MTEFQPLAHKDRDTTIIIVAETDGVCGTLERHSFSELVASAGELLHTP